MSDFSILAWQPLLRPPLPGHLPVFHGSAQGVPLKGLACRNQTISLMALVVSSRPVSSARLVVSDLACDLNRIPATAIKTRLVGVVPTPEAGPVCDPLYEVEEFSIDKCAAIHISVRVPRDACAGKYHGIVALVIDGDDVATNSIEIEVADVVLPDVRDWSFFLNVWMNPGAVARWYGVELWSDEHFKVLRPYVEDLAIHGQKTVVVPICYRPWGTQTRDPYPNCIRWIKRGDSYQFDFSVFDRYVELHQACGIDRAIHCFTMVQGNKDGGNTIEFYDADAGVMRLVEAAVGDEFYTQAWGVFLRAFVEHLSHRGWLEKTYIAFDERDRETMEAVIDFIERYAPELGIALAGNIDADLYSGIDDLSLHIEFNEKGVAQAAPAERSVIGAVGLLDGRKWCPSSRRCPSRILTTYYVCCGPAHPNTFLFSPLVESRMLPWLALQGGYDGFLRWSYNDWTDDPYTHPEWGLWPTGDVFFVYPGADGPVSSLRWELLREGIADYELAMIASANVRTPEEIVDYEQAVTLACRNVDGRIKSLGDIELARRLLIPIAERQI
ncbi:MAG: DUF4091 domain-containing protein [Armatimonadota bacterium]